MRKSLVVAARVARPVVGREPRREGLAADELHEEPALPAPRRPRPEDGRDRGVIEPGGDPALALEAAELERAELRVVAGEEELERRLAPEAPVLVGLEAVQRPHDLLRDPAPRARLGRRVAAALEAQRLADTQEVRLANHIVKGFGP